MLSTLSGCTQSLISAWYSGTRLSAMVIASTAISSSAANPAQQYSRTLRDLRMHLHQDDVVLIDGIQRFGLQADRLARDELQLAQRGGLLVEQPLDHVWVREDDQLLVVELPRLPHDLAKPLIANRLRRLDVPPPLAGWTSPAQQVFHAFARAFARHFDQAERRYRGNAGLCVIVGQGTLQRLNHLPAMIRLLHVDEIEDDDAAQVAQTQLPGDGHRRFEIGAEYGFLQISMAYEGAGIDVDRRHRLGLVDEQIPARVERHLAIQRLLDFLFAVIPPEHR